MMNRVKGGTGRPGRQNASLGPNWPRRAAMALVVLGFGVGGPLASPAMAGCLGHPEDNFCYIADVTINHNVDAADGGGSFVVIHSGATPQTAETGPNTLVGSASASSDGAHNGTVEVRSEVDNDDYYFVQAEASLSYTFQLSSTPGAPGDPLVPIRVTAFAQSLRNTTVAQEKATVEIDQGSRLAYAEQKILSGREIDLLNLDQTIYVQPDTDILITMYAESSVISGPGSLGSPGFGRASSGVFLDPTFEIDPAYASLYTLEGLPAGAVAAAPEPATWAMMAVGFGLVGGLMRYRRAFAPAALA
jgi:PEP-CTERM motif